ncbi:selenoprotein H-like isoform X2 [Durio zibethinus]|uniref:Selenoprotein H-like isoform X2 n=1 Tax=Durio zibethinus TaxID=66656 RepID=A0A6P5XS76_DURZI|nr:selenoprotein H-like isoform X2 [Durio zibethinus]
MAPRKRKDMDGDEEQAKRQGQETFKRVTRSMTRQPDGNSSELTQPNKEKPKARSKAKASAKENKESEEKVKEAEAVAVEEQEEDGAKAEAVPEDLTVANDGSHNKAVVVEHCNQCNSFKTRAFQVRDGLKKGVPGIKVLLNPKKPRRGCFEIREEDGEKFISLLDMKRPFKPMKDLDMEKVISDIIDKIK